MKILSGNYLQKSLEKDTIEAPRRYAGHLSGSILDWSKNPIDQVAAVIEPANLNHISHILATGVAIHSMLEKIESGWSEVEHEVRLISQELRFKGTPDMVAKHSVHGRTLIDFKTCRAVTSKLQPNILQKPEDKHICQVMSYAYIYEKVAGKRIDTVCIGYFKKDTSMFQEFYLPRAGNEYLFQKAIDNYTRVLEYLNTIDPI